MNGGPFDTVQTVGANSGLWRAALAIVRVGSSAWDASRTVRVVRSAAAHPLRWPASDRIRFGALVIAWAGVWLLAGLSVLPRYVTSGLPRTWLAGGSVAALLVSAGAGVLARAWSGSTLARVLNDSETP